MNPTRRDFLGAAGALGAVGGWLATPLIAQVSPAPSASGPADHAGDGPWTLPALPYGYADLEPHLDAQTLRLHHDIHHAGYVKAANAALASLAGIRRTGGEEIRGVRAATDALAFNLAGHLLHCVYWESMKRDGGGDPPRDGALAGMIVRDFGSLEAFYGHFQAAAAQVQGAGWAILAYEPLARRLLVLQAEKHQVNAPCAVAPLLALDVWEHAYYLKFQNERSRYVKAFMNVVNWAAVEARLASAVRMEQA